MKLILRRRQAEKKGGIFSSAAKGMNFALSAKVELTPAEQKLVETYGMEYQDIAHYEDPTLKERERHQRLTLTTIMKGFETGEIGDINVVLTLEEDIQRGCEGFKALLSIMEGYAGEKVMEY